MTTNCPKCGAEVAIPESQRNAAKVILRCSCGNVFIRRGGQGDEAKEKESPVGVGGKAPAPAPLAAEPLKGDDDDEGRVSSVDWGPGVVAPVSGQSLETKEPTAPSPEAPASAGPDYVLVIRSFGTDRAKHLTARLLVEESRGKKSYSEFKEAFDRTPYVIYGITGKKLEDLSKTFSGYKMEFDGGLIAEKMCSFHNNQLRAAECPGCQNPLCDDCRSEGELCRDCREMRRLEEEKRRLRIEEAARSIPVYDAVLPPGRAVGEVLGLVSAETLLDESTLIAVLSKETPSAEAGGSRNALEAAKESALQKLRHRAKALAADAVVNLRLDYVGFDAHGAGKTYLLLAVSGAAVKWRGPGEGCAT